MEDRVQILITLSPNYSADNWPKNGATQRRSWQDPNQGPQQQAPETNPYTTEDLLWKVFVITISCVLVQLLLDALSKYFDLAVSACGPTGS